MKNTSQTIQADKKIYLDIHVHYEFNVCNVSLQRRFIFLHKIQQIQMNFWTIDFVLIL